MPARRPDQIRTTTRARIAAVAGLACAATALTACAGGGNPPANTATETGPMDGYVKVLDDPRKEWPFKFEHHDFGIACYDAIGCQVRYGGDFPHGARDEDERSPPKRGDLKEAQRGWNGTRLAVEAFAGPVRARWKSLDGEQHEVTIDLDEVFPDRAVLHDVKFEELSDRGAVGRPEIVVAIDDRTISVWMRAMVPLKELDDPNNRFTKIRNKWIKAWSRTL